ncbi:MAG: glycoside hydrolase family 140 protein [Bacteroidota bacterium]
MDTWRTPFLFFLLILGFQISYCQSLDVSDTQRYLVREDGTPFFYLGDTAWELFHRLSAEEAEKYLRNRAAKGFTVIQAVVLAQLGGLAAPNANGDLPLEFGDPTKPIEAYFEHVDSIVRMANDLGLFIGMLPTWGSYWSQTNGNNAIFTTESAYTFGKYVGQRYKEDQVIWILGGDENIQTSKERALIEAMAKGIQEGDGGKHLMTFHPRGPGRSSDYFHTAEWLDFHMYQSSHGSRDHDNGLFAEHDYQLPNPKPTLDGEPRYELIPVGFYFKEASPSRLFDDYDTRQAAYWSILAGACGHTYGHNSIWQMYSPDKEPVIGAIVPWNWALDNPGAFQMGHLRKLFEKRPFHKLIPNTSILLGGPTSGGAKIRVAVAEDSSFAIVYSPRGAPFTIEQNVIKGTKLKAIWYDPRYGIPHPTHTGNTHAIQTYTPPSKGRGNDWILILEDAEAGFELPY